MTPDTPETRARMACEVAHGYLPSEHPDDCYVCPPVLRAIRAAEAAKEAEMWEKAIHATLDKAEFIASDTEAKASLVRDCLAQMLLKVRSKAGLSQVSKSTTDAPRAARGGK